MTTGELPPRRPVTTVIGIDGSLTATGLAVWRDGRFTSRTIHTAPGVPVEDRWRYICGHIWPAITTHCVAAIEGVFKGAKGRQALDLAMVHAVIRYGLHARAVQFAIVDPQAIKQYATGKGNASKDEVIAAAEQRLGATIGDHNQADSLWLVAMTLHHYGRPMCSTTPAQAAVLDRISWPEWSFPDD